MSALKTPWPVVDTAPYWRATTPDEIGRIANNPPPPGAYDFVPGWDLAFLSVAQADGTRLSTVGWVRGCFGITELASGDEFNTLYGNLTHLPTGYRIAVFFDAGQAAFAAAGLEDVCDWGGLEIAGARDVGRNVLQRVRDLGFDDFRLVDSGINIWVRFAPAVH